MNPIKTVEYKTIGRNEADTDAPYDRACERCRELERLTADKKMKERIK